MIVALPGASVTASIGPLWQGGGFLLPQKGLCRNLYLLIGLPSCQAGRMSLELLSKGEMLRT